MNIEYYKEFKSKFLSIISEDQVTPEHKSIFEIGSLSYNNNFYLVKGALEVLSKLRIFKTKYIIIKHMAYCPDNDTIYGILRGTKEFMETYSKLSPDNTGFCLVFMNKLKMIIDGVKYWRPTKLLDIICYPNKKIAFNYANLKI